MGPRYAVLWGVDGAESIEIGLAVERGDHVYVDLPDHLCVPANQRGEYRVLQPDGSELLYRPGDPGYFDQVLLDLSRTFAIGEQGELPDYDKSTVMRAVKEKVTDRILNKRRSSYQPRKTVAAYEATSEPIARSTAHTRTSTRRVALMA